MTGRIAHLKHEGEEELSAFKSLEKSVITYISENSLTHVDRLVEPTKGQSNAR
jgi:hypothetical protein